MAVDIDSLQIEIEATSSDAASKIDQLAAALTNLKSAAKGGAGLTTTTKQLQALSNAAKLINGTNLNSQKIQQFASAMNSLANIQKASGLNSTINALKKLPEISSAIEGMDLGKFATQMQAVASAMAPLATQMQMVANGFAAFPARIQRLISSNSALVLSNSNVSSSFATVGRSIKQSAAKYAIYILVFRRIASAMSDWVKESNDYVENLNLFTVAMGDYAEEAKTYAEEVQAAMGIDPSEWMRNQGVFMQMASGFGVAADDAALMSKNLTQLGYDISSFYNIGIEEAMEKLQSGLAGEIEPLRRLGYAIDQASLEQVALNNGITDSVLSMSQAEKSQLRYIAIMEQSTNAMGDLSRTIQTPANAMRILNQQITQLSRALGNLLIPLLQQIIPWVQAFVEVLTDAVQALAVFFGFELPTIDYSGLDGVSAGASEAEDAIGGATDAAKAMKRELLGIDELTILEPSNAGGTGSGAGGAAGDLGLDLPEYEDFGVSFMDELAKQTDEYKKKIEDILKVVLAVGAAFAAWKIATGLASGILGVQKGVGLIKTALTALAGLAPVKAALSWLSGTFAALAIQFNAAGGGVSGFLAVLKLIATSAAPAIAIFAVIISTLKVLIERWDDIKAAVSAIFEELKISERFQELQEKLDVLAEKLGWVNGFWEGMKDVVGTLMDFIGGTVITLIGTRMIGVFNALIEVLGGLIDVVTGVVDVLSGLATFVVGVFTGDLEKAADGVDQIGIGIQEVFGGLWNAVVGGVTEFVNGVITSISELGGTLLNEKIPEILQGFKDWWGDIVDFFRKEIPDWWNTHISPWFTAAKWKELGNKALEGLFSGLSNIGNKIKTWGGNLIAGVKNFFGIHSPSRLFREEIGLNLGLGISKGIGDSERNILSEVTKAGNMMRSALTISDMPTNFSVEQATRNVQEITGSVAVRSDSSDSDNGSMDVVNAIYAMAQRIVTAIEENSGDIYVESDGTATQNRKNRMYGKTLQYI